MLNTRIKIIRLLVALSLLGGLLLAACQGGEIVIQIPGEGWDGGGGGGGDGAFLNNQFLFILIIIMILFVAMIAILR